MCYQYNNLDIGVSINDLLHITPKQAARYNNRQPEPAGLPKKYVQQVQSASTKEPTTKKCPDSQYDLKKLILQHGDDAFVPEQSSFQQSQSQAPEMQRYYAQVIPLDGIDPNQQIRQINAIDESLRQTMSMKQSQESIFVERPEPVYQPPKQEQPAISTV